MDLSRFFELGNPDGQAWMIRTIRSFRENYGEKWRDQLEADHPDLFLVVELSLNKPPEAAFLAFKTKMLQAYFPSFFQRTAADLAFETLKPVMFQMHALIKSEATRPLLEKQ